MDAATFLVCLALAGVVVFGTSALRRSARNRELDELRRNIDARARARAARPCWTDATRADVTAWQPADDGSGFDIGGDAASPGASPCCSAPTDVSSSSCSSGDPSSSPSSSSD